MSDRKQVKFYKPPPPVYKPIYFNITKLKKDNVQWRYLIVRRTYLIRLIILEAPKCGNRCHSWFSLIRFNAVFRLHLAESRGTTDWATPSMQKIMQLLIHAPLHTQTISNLLTRISVERDARICQDVFQIRI